VEITTMTIATDKKSDFAVGLSKHSCEITPEMQAVMDRNSRAVAEMMALPRDGSVPVRYSVIEIDALKEWVPILRPHETHLAAVRVPDDCNPA
jgi:hypothetical protein